MRDTSRFSILREQTGLSINEVAERTGRTSRTIYRWENGETTPDKLVTSMLHKIAESAEVAYNAHSEQFTFIDLFAGIGGMRTGFESIGGNCFLPANGINLADKYIQQFRQATLPLGVSTES